MITKKDIEKLPTVLRQNIYEHYNMCLDKAKADYEKAANAYVATSDEKHRGVALTAQGEINILTAICNLFKTGIGENNA